MLLMSSIQKSAWKQSWCCDSKITWRNRQRRSKRKIRWRQPEGCWQRQWPKSLLLEGLICQLAWSVNCKWFSGWVPTDTYGPYGVLFGVSLPFHAPWWVGSINGICRKHVIPIRDIRVYMHVTYAERHAELESSEAQSQLAELPVRLEPLKLAASCILQSGNTVQNCKCTSKPLEVDKATQPKNDALAKSACKAACLCLVCICWPCNSKLIQDRLECGLFSTRPELKWLSMTSQEVDACCCQMQIGSQKNTSTCLFASKDVTSGGQAFHPDD